MEKRTAPARLSRKALLVIIVVLLVIVVALGYLAFSPSLSPVAQAKAEVEKVVSQVSELILLPEAGAPSLATVKDVSKLAGQPFFKNARDGDKLLIYPRAGKAILYRPGIHKIINVGPVVFDRTNAAVGNTQATPGGTDTTVLETGSAEATQKTETASSSSVEGETEATSSSLDQTDRG